MNTADDHPISSEDALGAALGAFQETLHDAAARVADERAWSRERNQLRDALIAAADHSHRLPDDFEETWGAKWWTAICALRDFAGVRSTTELKLPAGLGYDVARVIIDRGLRPEGSSRQVVIYLRRAVAVMLPRAEMVSGVVDDGTEPTRGVSTQAFDLLPPEDRITALREVFRTMLQQVLTLVDLRWQAQVPAARTLPEPLDPPPSAAMQCVRSDAADLAEPMPPPPVQDANASRWTAHRTGGPLLRGWRDIGIALGYEAEDVAKKSRFLQRHNRATKGPIVVVRRRPQVDRGELGAWFADSRAQRAALEETDAAEVVGTQEPGERGGLRARDLKMRIVKSPRGGPTRLAKEPAGAGSPGRRES